MSIFVRIIRSRRCRISSGLCSLSSGVASVGGKRQPRGLRRLSRRSARKGQRDGGRQNAQSAQGPFRRVRLPAVADFLPAYAPFGKVALVNVKNKDRFKTLEDLNQPDVRVNKNPGGTNEAFVLANLKKAQISTHDKNYEIPGLIAEDKGDVMITENAEAKLYAKKNPKLHAAFLDHPLTPVNYMGFLMPTDDADYTRVMNYLWDLLDRRGELERIEDKWLD